MILSEAQLSRTYELLSKLENRALSCPGLYAVPSQLGLLNLATDQCLEQFLTANDLPKLTLKNLEQLCLILENYWRNPALSHQHLAQSLLRHRPSSPKAFLPGHSNQEQWLDLVRIKTSPSIETPCQQITLKAASP